ncbi:MAG: zf-HC2 domain-containing protein [Clostridium sp.]|nr:zf-HC2 domain-containing protein [Acetatifactor muris]MCM1527730.1 zf-HC2 domain-containing protein [Bacteroides sp.]MCM1563942.1 zf-HC2 domain-containing protein [Clostridium sp.]
MTCKEFEHLIPEFLGQKMDFLTLKKFCEHMESCDECREELTIQFLVTEGLQRLEEGGAFDLQSELDGRIEEAQNRVKFHSLFLYLGAGLETLVIAGIIGFVIWVLL